MSKADREVGRGLRPRRSNAGRKEGLGRRHRGSTTASFGTLVEKLRKEGKAVIGGHQHTDKLEMDRDFGTGGNEAAA